MSEATEKPAAKPITGVTADDLTKYKVLLFWALVLDRS
jgi:hypothetical protein